MTTKFFATPKFGFIVAVALLALHATSAMPANSAGSGTFVRGKAPPVQYKDVYAFRAEDSGKNPVTVVILSASPLDKKAMTAVLKKEKSMMALRRGPFFDNMAYAQLDVDERGDIKSLYFFTPPGSNLNLQGIGTSDVKVNSAKRVEGHYFSDGKSLGGEPRKIDLRFATDLADVGPGVRN